MSSSSDPQPFSHRHAKPRHTSLLFEPDVRFVHNAQHDGGKFQFPSFLRHPAICDWILPAMSPPRQFDE